MSQKRYKKRTTITLDPKVHEILERYCKETQSNKAEVIRILIHEFLLTSNLVTNEEKTTIKNIDIIDFNRSMFSKYPLGIENNPEIQKRIIDLSNFEL
ncbi:ribbon-helix-helix protein, CopG family (plasmid) [Cyanobacterium aponinum AL20118]|uniref:Ribbon-helix-helix protein, CopG family n=1 Tax=Cyanobacterium aponinum AL20115 TaxID=3090662 RepID=A0AAF0ZIY6_9CHRO|nr:ribbon-helix-helix protein, CopG family [Cyanobacterium aponinum]WPF90514.1 ribbon-helix-helix protein, CopG family [Cyanobacterium aponinum AL20115]